MPCSLQSYFSKEDQSPPNHIYKALSLSATHGKFLSQPNIFPSLCSRVGITLYLLLFVLYRPVHDFTGALIKIPSCNNSGQWSLCRFYSRCTSSWCCLGMGLLFSLELPSHMFPHTEKANRSKKHILLHVIYMWCYSDCAETERCC